MDEVELKDCPFCGARADLYELSTGWSVECFSCPAGLGGNNWTMLSAIDIWNRRVDNEGAGSGVSS